jgi:hypothetical protein
VHLSVNIYCFGLKCVCRVSGISVLARAGGGGGGGGVCVSLEVASLLTIEVNAM